MLRTSPKSLLALALLTFTVGSSSIALANPGCRPGTTAAVVETAVARWGISPCGGGAESIRLLGKQFDMPEARPPSGALPGWASEKWSVGALQLVGTWDAKWDPFRDRLLADAIGPLEVSVGLPGEASRTRRSFADLDAMMEALPRWGTIAGGDGITLVWPDPERVSSPIYVQKRVRHDAERPSLLAVDLTVFWRGEKPLTIALETIVSTYRDPGTGDGGLLSSLSGPPDIPGAGLYASGEWIHHDANALDEFLGDAEADPAETSVQGVPSWIETDSRYFLLALLPGEGWGEKASARVYAVGNGVLEAAMRSAPLTLAGGEAACLPASFAAKVQAKACPEGDAAPAGSARVAMHYFAGPKEIDLLRSVGSDLDQSIDFGWFGAIARPLLFVLKVAHGFTGSWPIAILILTILVKALLWPIMGKSMKSMRKMSALKPELDKIKEELTAEAKKRGETTPDPAELNRRTFALYQQHGVNPLGGCLPMFLQMPVYIALYRTIYSSVELFNQPLFGWIGDLTRHDPFYVLPIVLAVLMFAQQRFAPMTTTTDDAQRKMMMYFMPAIFGLMMMSLPSGLTLYILTNTVLSMIQTFWLQRKEA